MPASPDRALAQLAARANAYQSWAVTTDRAARTANGRASANARFVRIVDAADPNGLMSASDREKAIVNARQAHYARMALASVNARRLRAAADVLDAVVAVSDAANADE